MNDGARRAGLRWQIVAALFALMAVLFLPLYFVLASVLTVTLREVRVESARGLGRAIAAHVAEVSRAGARGPDLAGVVETHVGRGGATAIAVWDPSGGSLARAGEGSATMDPPPRPFLERTRVVRGRHPGAVVLEIAVPHADLCVVTHVALGEDADRSARVARILAAYMGLFALALLVFAYLALTRLIVRPVEEIARAADRVASGARKLDVPIGGARELIELGVSVQTMTDALIANEDALRGKVDELTRATDELRRAQADLVRSDRLATVGRLAAGVAHEIGNPITAILGMHDLLDDSAPEERKDFLARMRRETERISKIVRDLLDFARPERDATLPSATTSALSLEPHDVAGAVDDVVALARAQKDFAAVDIVTEIDDPDVTTPLPRPRLVQVLLNLVLNAGAAVRGRSSARIVLRARALGDRVHIEVEDNGPGVPQELGDRVFLPFVTTKDVGQGTGLGLSVCRGLVEAAGGQIRLAAATGGGARFVIELPGG